MEILSVNTLSKLSSDDLIAYSHRLRNYLMSIIKYGENFDIYKIKDIFIYLSCCKELGLLRRNNNNNKITSLRNHLQIFNSLMCFSAELGGLDSVIAHYKSEKYNLMLEKLTNANDMFNIFFEAFNDYKDLKARKLFFDNTNIGENVDYYIENFFEPNLSIKKIAQRFHLNMQYMMRIYHKKQGKTIKYQIDLKKLSEAKKLIEHGVSITKTAYELGFSHSSVFTRLFKKYEGISPSAYLKQLKTKKRS